ncbi:MAG: ABC transporter permease [Anaerolineae bacterium]|nr:ABC transporter permease [Anaerolineae bacterium]
MLGYMLRRLAGGLIVLLVVSFLVFGALDVAPGDAADVLVGDSASAQEKAALRHDLGLDASLLARYGRFLAGLALHGDLGRSVMSGRPVTELIMERFPYTVALTLTAMGIAVALGSLAAVIASARPGSWLDVVIMGGALLGFSVPNFWLALLLIFIFAMKLGWLPVTGAGGMSHLLLPAVSLALPGAAVLARMLRSSIMEVRSADYVRTGHAKGMSGRYVFLHYVLRNGIVPVITVVGLQFGRLLGGAFIIETIFGWPGIGRLAVQAVFDRDEPVVVGVTLLIAASYLLANLAVDVLQAVLDPRVRGEVI